jgi:hypothetical protein
LKEQEAQLLAQYEVRSRYAALLQASKLQLTDCVAGMETRGEGHYCSIARGNGNPANGIH